MIKSFYIENYLSIKDKLEVDFAASKQEDSTYYNNYFSFGSNNILKAISFYGMNASGKSALISALSALKELITPMRSSSGLPYNPFLLSKDKKDYPTSFGIVFTTDNNPESRVYKYYVRYNKEQIIEEKLEKMTSQKPSLLYLRRIDNLGNTSIQIGQAASNTSLLEAIKETVIKDKTFISMFANFNIEDFYDIYKFFLEKVIIISSEMNRFIDIDPNNILDDKGQKEFTMNLLKAADFNIKGLHIEKIIKKNNLGNPIEMNSLFLEHEGEDYNGSIEFINESLGTKKMVILSLYLYKVFNTSSVLIIDEFESSLHPELCRLLVTSFLDESINKYNSQLIFTSHETSLLDLNLLRRDQIYFVYKDEKTCSTFVRSLKEFKVRLRDNVEKSYLAGRYQTSPNIDSYYLEMEDHYEEGKQN